MAQEYEFFLDVLNGIGGSITADKASKAMAALGLSTNQVEELRCRAEAGGYLRAHQDGKTYELNSKVRPMMGKSDG